MAASGTSMQFCRPTDSQQRLAVLGIIGVESQAAVRASIRSTWLPGGTAADVLALFVLRGIGALPETVAEAETHGDMVFLPSQSAQSRLVGPIWSLWKWYECALQAWPEVTLVGKAETDVWLDLPGIASRVHADFAALRRHARTHRHGLRGDVHMYWGVMESFHWDLHSQRPKGTCDTARTDEHSRHAFSVLSRSPPRARAPCGGQASATSLPRARPAPSATAVTTNRATGRSVRTSCPLLRCGGGCCMLHLTLRAPSLTLHA